MVVTNFDMSSTGVNIEVSLFWDNEMSQINFKENFVRFDDGKYFCVDCGNIETEEPFMIDLPAKKQKTKMKKVIRKMLKKDGYSNDDIEDCLSLNDEYLMHEWLYHNVYYGDYKSLINDLISEGIKFESDYIRFETRGYCQGDYAEVFLNEKKFLEVSGCEKVDIKSIQQQIDNMFWDSPLYYIVKINGEEYEGQWNGYYPSDIKYDRKEEIEYFIKLVKKDDSDIDEETLRNELENILPIDLDELDYK